MAGEANEVVGFLGQVTSADLPTFWTRLSRYGVVGAGSLKPTKTGTGDRAVTIAAGTAWGDGIRATWDGPFTVNGDTVTSGDRWDTVVIRYTWQPELSPTGKATIVLLTGGTAKTITGTRTGAGVSTSDQPIALVRFSAGKTTVQDLIDLRAWGEAGGVYANSIEVTQYLDDPGTALTIGDVLYRRKVDPDNGTVSWKTTDLHDVDAVIRDSADEVARLSTTGTYGTGMQASVNDGDNTFYVQKPGASPSTPVVLFKVDGTEQITVGNLDYTHLNGEITDAAGIASKGADWTVNRSIMLRRGDERELWLELHRTGPTLGSPANGDITDTVVATLKSGDTPPSILPCGDSMYRTAGSGGSTHRCGVFISGANIVLGSLTPNIDLTQQTGNAATSLWVHARWNR